MLPGAAPIAIRMPSSRRRLTTAKLITPYTPSVAINSPIEPDMSDTIQVSLGTMRASRT